MHRMHLYLAPHALAQSRTCQRAGHAAPEEYRRCSSRSSSHRNASPRPLHRPAPEVPTFGSRSPRSSDTSLTSSQRRSVPSTLGLPTPPTPPLRRRSLSQHRVRGRLRSSTGPSRTTLPHPQSDRIAPSLAATSFEFGAPPAPPLLSWTLSRDATSTIVGPYRSLARGDIVSSPPGLRSLAGPSPTTRPPLQSDRLAPSLAATSFRVPSAHPSLAAAHCRAFTAEPSPSSASSRTASSGSFWPGATPTLPR